MPKGAGRFRKEIHSAVSKWCEGKANRSLPSDTLRQTQNARKAEKTSKGEVSIGHETRSKVFISPPEVWLGFGN
ncbi:hypothetical protein E2C01_099127 [Portunus trituberculatus]|uniref:Uncharacterized protein n=1 Tax=Portunus trituberculatus TaxID=210409 RepID=A0A5B7KA69_PORTR|nr:hypothetical protein [Portunus trituberculatus]